MGVTRIPFDEEIMYIKNKFNIPEGYEIPCYLALGYPANDAKTFSPKEINIDDKIHIGKW
jgi:hypothetical protein